MLNGDDLLGQEICNMICSLMLRGNIMEKR